VSSITYRKLDSNGDYIFGQPSIEFLTDTDAVAQAIKTRLLLLYSEWWESTTDGTPFWQEILGASGVNKSSVDGILQERILGTTGVNSISSFLSTYTNRKYTFTASVITDYGTTVTVSS
jgi:pantothenate kinase-related protein Tda10